MNEFDDIDRELDTAFSERPSVLSRPSLRDVKRRARRHQRQRSAGVLGACAIVGVGGAAVLATRSPANQTTLGEGEAAASTICFPTESTFGYYDSSTAAPLNTLPATTFTDSGTTYVLRSGDNPTSVAAMFGVSLDAMNAANASTPDYGLFYEGLEIKIPDAPVGSTTPSLGIDIAGDYILQSGDFPASIAERFGVTLAELDLANRGNPEYTAWLVGNVIHIPFPNPPTTTNVVYQDVPDSTSFPEPSGYTTAVAVVSDVNCVPVIDGFATTTSVAPATSFQLTKLGTVIQVANCSNQEGVARLMSNQLAQEAFTMAEPDTCTIDLPVTKILYNPDDPAAIAVAKTLTYYLIDAVLEASGPTVPTLTTGTWAPGSGVLVLLGDDLAGKTLAQIATSESTGTTIPFSTIPESTVETTD